MPAGIADAEIQRADAEPLLVEVKRTLRPATLGVVMAQLQRFGRPGVLVTDYVTPQLAEKLKELNIPFLDVAGNVYLKTPNNFIYVTGGRQEKAQRAYSRGV